MSNYQYCNFISGKKGAMFKPILVKIGLLCV